MPPLPWKKAGFSRLVADHLNSAKQGGSLVVETGFPTSIVDLFVKNRDGIKRSSKKKKRNRRIRYTESLAGDSTIGDSTIADSSIADSSCPASPAKSITSPIHHRMTRNPSLSSFSGSPVPEIESFSPAIGYDGKSERAKKVCVGMLKILFLVVLALGRKQFAIGITVLAFLLHIMEFLGKCMYRLLEQYQYAYFSFRHFIEQVVCNLRSKIETEPTCNSMEEENQTDEDEEEEEETNSLPPRGRELRSETLGNLNHGKSLCMDWISEIIMDDTAEELLEIQRNSNKNLSRKIKSKIMKLWVSKKKQEEEDLISVYDSDYDYDYDYDSDSEDEVADEKPLKNLKKKKGIKAKINQIIPKKLKILTKKNTYQKKYRSTMYERFEEGSRFEEESDSQTIDNSYEHESFADDDQILSFNNEDISSSSSDESEMEESPKKEELVFCEKKTMWTMKRTSIVVLIPVILIGLEGGRFWAIVFTMICCSVFKLVTMSSKFFQLMVANLER